MSGTVGRGQVVIWLHGKSGCGKSTIAAELAEQGRADGRLVYVLARDRERDNWGVRTGAAEAMVTAIEDAIAHAVLRAGATLVVDQTNLRPVDAERWRRLAASHGVPCVRADADRPLDACIEADARRPVWRRGMRVEGARVGAETIARQAALQLRGGPGLAPQDLHGPGRV